MNYNSTYKSDNLAYFEVRKLKVTSFVISLLPLMAIIRFPFFNIGLGTFMLIVLFPLVFFKGLSIKIFPKGSFFIIIYFLYYAIRSIGVNIQIIVSLIALIYIITSFNKLFDLMLMRKVIETVSLIASCIVIVQNIWHYTIGGHLQFNNVSILLDELEIYKNLIVTGFGGNLYRPSAFFLEPAHFSQYAIIGLISVLFIKNSSQINYKRAFLISSGIILTTSGIGIALVSFVWGLNILSNNKSRKASIKLIYIFVSSLFGIALFFVLMQFNFFSSSVSRIFGSANEMSAIQGRLFWWDSYFYNFSGLEKYFGLGYTNIPEVYFTAFMRILYCSGYVGVFLFLLSLIRNIWISRSFSRIVTIVLIVLFFFTGIGSVTGLVFYFSIICAGAYKTDNN